MVPSYADSFLAQILGKVNNVAEHLAIPVSREGMSRRIAGKGMYLYAV